MNKALRTISGCVRLTMFLFVVGFLFPSNSHAQQSNDKAIHIDESDAKKEEIQRYIGYEDLLYRYMSLPYDSTMNINERGNFIDIGYIFLMFLPLMFMILMLNKHPWLSAITFLLMLFLLIISTSNSFILDQDKGVYSQTKDGQRVAQIEENWSTSPGLTMVSKIYKVTNAIYAPFDWLSKKVSGQKDHITYPILILLFILSGFMIFRMLSNQESVSLWATGFLFFNYSFFWLVLSSGIIWYGFLMLCLGTILLFLLLDRIKKYEPFHYKWLYPSFVGMSSIWIVLVFALRLGNISGATPPVQYGKLLFHPVLYDFSSGVKTEKEVVDKLYPNFYATINRINQDKSALIYRIGTSFTYFVENNHKRVFQDNQLGFYNELARRYPDKDELMNVLKASGFKYVIVDLNTNTIDKTENRSLTQKYNSFMNYIFENPRVKILSTNRVIEVKDPNGSVKNYYGLFGRRVFNGSYAILELL